MHSNEFVEQSMKHQRNQYLLKIMRSMERSNHGEMCTLLEQILYYPKMNESSSHRFRPTFIDGSGCRDEYSPSIWHAWIQFIVFPQQKSVFDRKGMPREEGTNANMVRTGRCPIPEHLMLNIYFYLPQCSTYGSVTEWVPALDVHSYDFAPSTGKRSRARWSSRLRALQYGKILRLWRSRVETKPIYRI